MLLSPGKVSAVLHPHSYTSTFACLSLNELSHSRALPEMFGGIGSSFLLIPEVTGAASSWKLRPVGSSVQRRRRPPKDQHLWMFMFPSDPVGRNHPQLLQPATARSSTTLHCLSFNAASKTVFKYQTNESNQVQHSSTGVSVSSFTRADMKSTM